MQKARSRLQKTSVTKQAQRPSFAVGRGRLTKRVVNKLHRWERQQRQLHQGHSFLSWFLNRWRIICACCIGVLSIISILLWVQPNTIADWILPQTYLPLLICVGCTVYFFSRLWLSVWHACCITLMAVWVFFVKLHALSLPTVFWYWFFGMILVFESVYFATQKLLVKKWFSDILRHSKVKTHQT